jgi:hypothetical protein
MLKLVEEGSSILMTTDICIPSKYFLTRLITKEKIVTTVKKAGGHYLNHDRRYPPSKGMRHNNSMCVWI